MKQVENPPNHPDIKVIPALNFKKTFDPSKMSWIWCIYLFKHDLLENYH